MSASTQIKHAGPKGCQTAKTWGLASCAAALVSGSAVVAAPISGPLPGETIKFEQKPLDATFIVGQAYYGHDEASTSNSNAAFPGNYTGSFVADDFSDAVTAPIVHISWWGSYIASSAPQSPVQKFVISIESDVPSNTSNPFSHPGTPLSTQIVTVTNNTPAAGSGNFLETPYSAGGAPLNEAVYQYDAELAFPFNEQAGTVYWLKIAALNDNPNNPLNWGWHDRDYTQQDPYAVPSETNIAPTGAPFPIYHFGDDAVSGSLNLTVNNAGDPVNGFSVSQTNMSPLSYQDNIDGPRGISSFSQDQSFALYYAPEPSTLGLTGLIGLGALRRRRSAAL